MAEGSRTPGRGAPRRYDHQIALVLSGMHPELKVRQQGDRAVVMVKRTDVAEYGPDGLRLLPRGSPEALSLEDPRDRGRLRARIAERVNRVFPPRVKATRQPAPGATRKHAAVDRRRAAAERTAAEERRRAVAEREAAEDRRRAVAEREAAEERRRAAAERARPPTAVEWKAALAARGLEPAEVDGIVRVVRIGVVPAPSTRGEIPSAIKALIAAETAKCADALEAHVRAAIDTQDPRVTVKRRPGRLQVRVGDRAVASVTRFAVHFPKQRGVHDDLLANPSALSCLAAPVRDALAEHDRQLRARSAGLARPVTRPRDRRILTVLPPEPPTAARRTRAGRERSPANRQAPAPGREP